MIVFDPRKTHLSDLFSGTRYALTFFYHLDAKEVSQAERDQLKQLGFPIDTGILSVPIVGNQDSLQTAAAGQNIILPPEIREHGAEPDLPLLPKGLRPTGKQPRGLERVKKALPKPKKIMPFAGGTLRSQKLLENIEKIIRHKQVSQEVLKK